MKVNVKSAAKKAMSNKSVKYVLIVALVVLVGFSLMYIYNIQNATKRLEAFHGSGSSEAPTVLYLYSNSCPHCKSFEPTFNAVKGDNNMNAHFSSMEKGEVAANKYMNNVSGFPTVLVIDSKDAVVDKLVGNVDEAKLRSFVESAIIKA